MKRRGCLTNVLLAACSTVLTLFLIDTGIRVIWWNRIFTIEHRPDVPQVYRFPPGRTRHEVVHGDQAQPGDPIVQSWTVDWVTDLPVIDLTPTFLDLAASGDDLYFAQDTHWNAHAQQIVSQMLCQYLAGGG